MDRRTPRMARRASFTGRNSDRLGCDPRPTHRSMPAGSNRPLRSIIRFSPCEKRLGSGVKKVHSTRSELWPKYPLEDAAPHRGCGFKEYRTSLRKIR